MPRFQMNNLEPSREDMAACATRLSALAGDIASARDETTMRTLQRQLVMESKKVIWQCQSPFDALMDHTINAYNIGAISALMEIGVFEAIPLTGSATVKEIAQKCDAEEELIIRLMRQLTCSSIFTETNVHEWSHNRLSIPLSEHIDTKGKYFFIVAMQEMYPSFHNLYSYVKTHGKTDIKTYTNTPHSWHDNQPDKTFWEVLSSRPGRLNTFISGLSQFSALHPVTAIFPFETLIPTSSASRPSIVDIGGGNGQALLDLRTAYPELKGPMYLQDLPPVLAQIPDSTLQGTGTGTGITKQPHDFFTPQPVRNAQVYYIRRVMHDWQDADAARILGAVKGAMGADSRILVSDMALPELAGPEVAGAVWMDMMMLSIGGRERTVADWEGLAGLAGLRMVKVWMERERFGPLCVVEYRLVDGE